MTTPTVSTPAARAGAAAHAGGDERHVRTVQRRGYGLDGFFGGGLTDFRPGAGAEAFGQADAELDLVVAQGMFQRLRVGVGGDELDTFKLGADHVVDGIAAGAANADHGDARFRHAPFGRSGVACLIAHGSLPDHGARAHSASPANP